MNNSPNSGDSYQVSSLCVEAPTEPQDASPGLARAEVPFPTSPAPTQPQPCSFNVCSAGHQWPVILALAKCPGCTGAVMAMQKTNCPFCNEPIIRSVLRSDFLPRGAGVAARCQGGHIHGDSLDIDLTRTSWQEAEASAETFLEREARERAEVK